MPGVGHHNRIHQSILWWFYNTVYAILLGLFYYLNVAKEQMECCDIFKVASWFITQTSMEWIIIYLIKWTRKLRQSQGNTILFPVFSPCNVSIYTGNRHYFSTMLYIHLAPRSVSSPFSGVIKWRTCSFWKNHLWKCNFYSQCPVLSSKRRQERQWFPVALGENQAALMPLKIRIAADFPFWLVVLRGLPRQGIGYLA